MAILEKEVWVGLNHMNIKYYEKLGYEIPRRRDKRGRMTIPKGTKILIEINDLQDGSEVLVTRCCDDCGKKDNNITYNKITNIRKQGDGKDRCYNCTRNVAWYTRKSNMPYNMSLEYYAKNNNKEYLLNEYSDKNEKSFSEIFKSTKEIIIWECSVCNSEYEMSVNHRSNGSNCPYCAGRRVNDTNCLATTHPEIAILLLDTQLSYKISQGMDKKIQVKCDKCNFTEYRQIRILTRDGFNCSNCGDGISYPEKFMISFLSQLKSGFKRQEKFEWSMNKIYDFFIPNLNCVIETHGKQHYMESFIYMGGRPLKEEQENDRLKEKLAKENGIDSYIVIDCRESNIEHIKNSIMNSDLKNIYNLNIIDWHTCDSFAQKSLVKEACDLWNNWIKSTKKIGEKLNLSSYTIIRYLKQGNQLNWCDYDPITVQINNGKRTGRTKGKKVVQLTLEGDLVKIWSSATEAYRILGINNSSISATCLGRHQSAGGFKWIFEDHYKNDFKN